MSDWMYAHSLPLDMHPKDCMCGGCLSENIEDYDPELHEPIEDECPECNWIGAIDKGYCRFCGADVCSEIFD